MFLFNDLLIWTKRKKRKKKKKRKYTQTHGNERLTDDTDDSGVYNTKKYYNKDDLNNYDDEYDNLPEGNENITHDHHFERNSKRELKHFHLFTDSNEQIKTDHKSTQSEKKAKTDHKNNQSDKNEHENNQSQKTDHKNTQSEKKAKTDHKNTQLEKNSKTDHKNIQSEKKAITDHKNTQSEKDPKTDHKNTQLEKKSKVDDKKDNKTSKTTEIDPTTDHDSSEINCEYHHSTLHSKDCSFNNICKAELCTVEAQPLNNEKHTASDGNHNKEIKNSGENKTEDNNHKHDHCKSIVGGDKENNKNCNDSKDNHNSHKEDNYKAIFGDKENKKNKKEEKHKGKKNEGAESMLSSGDGCTTEKEAKRNKKKSKHMKYVVQRLDYLVHLLSIKEVNAPFTAGENKQCSQRQSFSICITTPTEQLILTAKNRKYHKSWLKDLYYCLDDSVYKHYCKLVKSKEDESLETMKHVLDMQDYFKHSSPFARSLSLPTKPYSSRKQKRRTITRLFEKMSPSQEGVEFIEEEKKTINPLQHMQPNNPTTTTVNPLQKLISTPSNHPDSANPPGPSAGTTTTVNPLQKLYDPSQQIFPPIPQPSPSVSLSSFMVPTRTSKSSGKKRKPKLQKSVSTTQLDILMAEMKNNPRMLLLAPKLERSLKRIQDEVDEEEEERKKGKKANKIRRRS
eukprot:CAMPEP_0174276966 /NCGR_PEP_ID=MMETSP0439-20130205/60674_1 /TAXON_ID=0 /ORGANISM="Stereomyxa ramosa, Strain Chinc5" /LENGTH=676 /DNA_ID=CAMNT_0015369243 /DNA_START=1008 /DNA_END=3034 /DNA_ORIENTATION=-